VGSTENYIRMSLNICIPHPIFSGKQIEDNEMGGAWSTNGDNGGVYRVLVGKPEGRRQFGRPRSRWEDNIKMDQEARIGGMD
jgi:hypothetical protein